MELAVNSTLAINLETIQMLITLFKSLVSNSAFQTNKLV